MSWKALYVASRAEKKINERLKETGIESYLPLKKEKKQWSDRKKIVITPLISGYVFVNVSDQNRDAVFNIKGILQYVRYNGGDAVIREEEINAMKSIEQKGYYAEGQPGTELNQGDMAVIKYGPFKGLQGKIESKNSESIYTISISSIGYSLTIKIPNEVLEKE